MAIEIERLPRIGLLALRAEAGTAAGRAVGVEQTGNAAALRAEQHLLGGGRSVNLIFRRAQVFRHQFRLHLLKRLERPGGKRPVKADDPRTQGGFRDPLGDQGQILHFLHITGKKLEIAFVGLTIIGFVAADIDRSIGGFVAGEVHHQRQQAVRRQAFGFAYRMGTGQGQGPPAAQGQAAGFRNPAVDPGRAAESGGAGDGIVSAIKSGRSRESMIG